MNIGKYQVTPKAIVIALSAMIIAFNLYILAWIPFHPYIVRGIFLSVFIIISALLNPPQSRAGKILITICTLMALAGSVYPLIFQHKLNEQFFTAEQQEVYVAIIFMIGLAGILTRISGGRVILILTILTILYAALGQYIPGYFGHNPMPLTYLASTLYTNLEMGIFGNLTEVSIRIISIFMIFSTLMQALGLGDLFIALSSRIARDMRGGPAKIAIFASGLFGMLSGSPIANVAGTGSFTIPAMKRIGYEPSVAASIEALASSGGNLMPPVMGVGAFLMAEILGIPYLNICIAVLVLVFLWYFTCFLIVHYAAAKYGVGKVSVSIEDFMNILKERWHLLIPIIVLVVVLILIPSAEQAAFLTVITLAILACSRKSTRFTKEKIVRFLENYANIYASLFLLVAAIGVFVAALTALGLHMKMAVVLFGDTHNLFIILLLTTAVTTAFGMVAPVMVAYLATVVLVTPILAQAGMPPLVTHMFVFYMSTLAPITPPVALASFTGAKIAGSPPIPTAVKTTLLGLPLWIIPFKVASKGLVIGAGTPWLVIFTETAIICLGVFLFTIGVTGYFKRLLVPFERIIAASLGVLLVQPVVDLSWIAIPCGLVLIIYLHGWAVQQLRKKLSSIFRISEGMK